jgi:Ribbon-helix-helix protein, copG family
MRTTVTLSEPVLRTAKRQAAERGVTLSELVEDALRFQLARQPSSAATPFQLHTVRGTLVQPELDLDRTSALETLDDESKFAAPPSR